MPEERSETTMSAFRKSRKLAAQPKAEYWASELGSKFYKTRCQGIGSSAAEPRKQANTGETVGGLS